MSLLEIFLPWVVIARQRREIERLTRSTMERRAAIAKATTDVRRIRSQVAALS